MERSPLSKVLSAITPLGYLDHQIRAFSYLMDKPRVRRSDLEPWLSSFFGELSQVIVQNLAMNIPLFRCLKQRATRTFRIIATLKTTLNHGHMWRV